MVRSAPQTLALALDPALLFELRGQSSRQFALYRVIAAKPEQIFATTM